MTHDMHGMTQAHFLPLHSIVEEVRCRQGKYPLVCWCKEFLVLNLFLKNESTIGTIDQLLLN